MIKKLINRISEKTKLSKKLMLVLLLFFIGLAALLLSELQSEDYIAAETTTRAADSMSADEYTARLEERLTSIVSAVEGAGETRVMVTLESGSEQIYLYNSDYGEDIQPSSRSSYEQNREYVIIGDGEDENGIVVRVVEPKVRGVAIVCEGGGSDTVKQQIVETVTALLDISSASVSVVKME